MGCAYAYRYPLIPARRLRDSSFPLQGGVGNSRLDLTEKVVPETLDAACHLSRALTSDKRIQPHSQGFEKEKNRPDY